MDMIIGLGEVGTGIMQLLKGKRNLCGIDISPGKSFGNYQKYDFPTSLVLKLMHICIPYTESFNSEVCSYILEYPAEGVIIHSTVKPRTTKIINDIVADNLHSVPQIFYSPVRGVHARMIQDLQNYTKFYASYTEGEDLFAKCFHDDCGLNVRRISNPYTLEIMKPLMDTTYYGWIIAFWQLVDKVCKKYNLDFGEVASYVDEIQKFTGTRPKMYVDPNGIGGHCVLPNLNLLEDVLPEVKEIILKINEETKRRYNATG